MLRFVFLSGVMIASNSGIGHANWLATCRKDSSQASTCGTTSSEAVDECKKKLIDNPINPVELEGVGESNCTMPVAGGGHYETIKIEWCSADPIPQDLPYQSATVSHDSDYTFSIHGVAGDVYKTWCTVADQGHQYEHICSGTGSSSCGDISYFKRVGSITEADASMKFVNELGKRGNDFWTRFYLQKVQ